MIKKLLYVVIGVLIVMGVLKYKTGIITLAQHATIEVDILIEKNEAEIESDRYITLTNNMTVSGNINGKVVPRLSDEKYARIEYKINDAYYAAAYSPTYVLDIDTTRFPNGLNKLSVIGYEESGKVRGVKQVVFNIQNEEKIEPRAERKTKTYDVKNQPIYKKKYIPVLMYHDFQEKISSQQQSAVVHPELFEKQLQALIKHGYTPIHFKDLYLYINKQGGLPKKPIIITTDDGYLSNYETVFPILKKYNIPATYFVTTQYIGVKTVYPHFTWEQAREMEESGLIDIQSHTHSHSLLSELPKDEVLYQTSISFGLIEQNLGKRDIKVLSYPQFYNNKNTKKWLQEQGVHLQITNLAKQNLSETKAVDIKRIHVANYTTPEKLIEEIKQLTE